MIGSGRGSWWAVALVLAAGCGSDKAVELAPSATGSALASSAPKSAAAKELAVKKEGSVTFTMEAPIEIIRGKVADANEGKLFIDAKDLTQTTGNIAVDVSAIELFQRKKAAEGDKDYGEEVKEPKQNDHAREWLEISEKTAEADRTKNKRLEFRISAIDSVDKKDVSATDGEVKVAVKASGDFLLHGRVTKHTVEIEATLTVKGGVVTAAKLKTAKPFAINLREHDVGPRDDVGKGLDRLQPKVAKEALVSLELSAG